MKLKLLRAARIRHEAGEIVEVSPAEAGFLLSTGSAVKVQEAPKKRETPEDKKETEEKLAKERALQEAMLELKHKYGKNAVVKAKNLNKGGTAMERNEQIGGHKA